MNRFFYLLFNNPGYLLGILWRKIGYFVPDKPYLEVLYFLVMGKRLNLKNPKSYNEKLQWLKLYDRNPEYVKMVDKFVVKDFVAKRIGGEYIIPTLGVWDNAEDIEWDKLPNQFVLKCTHDSGGLVVCKDKNKLDKKAAINKLNKGLKREYFKVWREWPYKDVPRRIIAEKYMEDEQIHELRDYKFFCFGGQVKMFKIDFDRFIEHHANYYDINLQLLPFGEATYPPKPEKQLMFPSQIKEMFQLAEKLSKDIPFLRVDFYHVNSNIYFGELTFFPATGMGKWTDEKWDIMLGEWITLPNE